MPRPPKNADIESQMELWSRSFVDWSQSPFGFYTYRRPDPTKKRKFIYEDTPVIWQPHQERIFRYVLTLDENGKLPFSQFLYLDVGQSGKSFFQAATAQWAGMFHEREAEVQLAANSMQQAEMRVYTTLRRSLERHPFGNEIADVQESRIKFLHTNNTVRALPLKASTQAGGTPVFRGFDEIWDYEGDHAKLFFDEIKESPASEFSLMVITSYPGFEDTDGPLNTILNQYFNADDSPKDNLERVFDDLPLFVNRDDDIAIWWNHDALRYPWHSQRFLDKKRRDPSTSENGYRRIWEAYRTSREDTFMPMDRWDDCEDETLYPLGPSDHDIPLVIVVDMTGGKHDSAAVSARSYDPVTYKYVLRAHKIWNPRDLGKEYDYNEAVEQWILDLHRRHKVIACGYDPYQFVGSAKKLAKAGVKMEEITQNIMRTTADTHYQMLIRNKQLRNYAQSQDLRRHVERAVARELSGGSIRIDKRKQSQQIDAAVADSMACYLAMLHKADFERLDRNRQKPQGTRKRRRDPILDLFFGSGA